jgi:hypothetical protein
MKAERETQRGKVCVCERAQGCLRAGITVPRDRRSYVVVCTRPGQFKVGCLLVCFALPSVYDGCETYAIVCRWLEAVRQMASSRYAPQLEEAVMPVEVSGYLAWESP